MNKVEGAKWRGSTLNISTDLRKQHQNNVQFSLVVLINNNNSFSSIINNSDVISLLITLWHEFIHFLSTVSHWLIKNVGFINHLINWWRREGGSMF